MEGYNYSEAVSELHVPATLDLSKVQFLDITGYVASQTDEYGGTGHVAWAFRACDDFKNEDDEFDALPSGVTFTYEGVEGKCSGNEYFRIALALWNYHTSTSEPGTVFGEIDVGSILVTYIPSSEEEENSRPNSLAKAAKGLRRTILASKVIL